MPYHQERPMTWARAITILVTICALVGLLFLGIWACTNYVKTEYLTPDHRPVPAPATTTETRTP
jgi:FtsZ-interacting cell division protein ZipA